MQFTFCNVQGLLLVNVRLLKSMSIFTLKSIGRRGFEHQNLICMPCHFHATYNLLFELIFRCNHFCYFLATGSAAMMRLINYVQMSLVQNPGRPINPSSIDPGSVQFGAPLTTKSQCVLVMYTFCHNSKRHESKLKNASINCMAASVNMDQIFNKACKSDVCGSNP